MFIPYYVIQGWKLFHQRLISNPQVLPKPNLVALMHNKPIPFQKIFFNFHQSTPKLQVTLPLFHLGQSFIFEVFLPKQILP